jgi:hypothetical protein
MSKVSHLRRAAALIGAVGLGLFGLVGPASATVVPASNQMWHCTGAPSVWCAPPKTTVNMRVAPNESAQSLDTLPPSDNAVLGCWASGQSVNGDNIWYNSFDYQWDNGNYLNGPNGYIAGFWLNTGADPNPAIPHC